MEKLSIEEFGTHLLHSEDLDPIYVMLNRAMFAGVMTKEELHAWCVAYWMDYNAGVACEAIEYCRLRTQGLRTFWKFMEDVAKNTSRRWPRGSERRHFRGKNATDLVSGLFLKYKTPTDFVQRIFGENNGDIDLKFNSVAGRVQTHTGFGPWIAFKIADMGERVLGYSVNFDDCQLGIYRDPIRGAVKAVECWGTDCSVIPDSITVEKWCLNYAINRLMETFGDLYAPPLIQPGGKMRFINVQEVETILCKWKSHMNGHYPLNKDTREIRETLEEFGRPACSCEPEKLATKLAKYLPQVQSK